MNRFKKITLWTLAIILIFIVQGVILTIIYEKEIKQAAVTEINKSLNTKIQVGTIQLNYWKHFPYISLLFEQTIIPGSLPKPSINLLEANEIAMLFNFWELYQGKFKVHQLIIKDATWNSLYNQQGKSNFDILRESDKNQSTPFQLDLKKILFENVYINHYDFVAHDQFQFYISKGTAKGMFTEQELEITLSSTGKLNLIMLGRTNYLKNKPLKIDGNLHVDLKTNTYIFNNTRMQLEQLGALINGSYAYSAKKSNYDLQINGDQIELEQLKDFAPISMQKKLKEYEGSGTVELNCKIFGEYSAASTPLIDIKAGLTDASISLKTSNANATIKKLGAIFLYSNRNTRSQSDDYIFLEKITANLNDQKLSGFLKITQLNEPNVELQVITKQELKNLTPFISEKRFTPTSGNVELDIYLKGAYRDMISNNRFAEIKSKGSIKFNNANFSIQDSKIGLEKLNAVLQFERFDLKIEDLSLQIGNSDFRVKGYFRNVLAGLFQENQNFEADLLIASDRIDLYELLSSNTKTEEQFKLHLSKSVSAKIKFDVKKLEFNKFKSNNLIGDIKIKDQIISSEYFAFRSQEGLVFSNMYFNTQNPKAMPMSLDFHLEKIDIHQMFYEFGDFGLSIITNKNIYGNVTTDMHVDMMWDENLNSDITAFYAKGDVTIENGKLLKFDPLLALSKYIDINDLVDLRFSKMENTIEIKNQMIFIPNMHVSSNAIDMDLSGTHTFENIVDYHIRVLLSDVLWKKSKRNNDSQFGEIESDGTGKSSLFIRMYGPADNPKFSLDKLMIKKKIKEDLKKERSIVKDVLKEEFKGWFKKDQEFREQQNEIPEPWETDLPQKKTPAIDKAKTDSVTKKSKLSRLKEKLSEPIETDE